MRYLMVVTVVTVTMFVFSTWQIETFAATTHSEAEKHHVEKQEDTSLGKDVYERVCAACHDSGVAGAIKITEKKTWKAHVHHGIDHMVESVVKGKGAMPARGGDPNLTDEEIESAVHYIIQQTQ